MSTQSDDDAESGGHTIRDPGPDVNATVLDPVDARRREDGETHRDDNLGPERRSLLRLPGTLAQRFGIVGPLPTAGSEADLLVVENQSGERFVAKIYRSNIEPKSDVLEVVSSGSPAHVIKLHEHGRSEGVCYELLEYAPFGSLREIMAQGPLDDSLAEEVLSELAAAIAHLHQLGVIHRDLKPENVLVRAREPLDLVFADFGIASMAASTVHFTSNSRTIRYGAPESSSGAIGPSVDYWALGIVLVEMLTGQHPFEGLSEAVINHWLATRPVDVSDVPQRWRKLCSGLLVRDPKNRWGTEHLARWLAGARDIPVADDVIATATQLFPFEGGRYQALSDLAPAFAQHWEAAVRAVERGNLSVWLQRELREFDTFNIIEDLRNDISIDKDERLFLILARFCPQLPPIWKGRSLDRESLIAMATPGNQYLLHEVLTRGLLGKYDKLMGLSENSALENSWTQISEEIRSKWRDLGTRGGPVRKQPVDAALAAASLLIVTTPAFVAQLQATAEEWLENGANDCSWFSGFGDGPADLLIIGIVGEDAIKDIERVRAEAAAAEVARRAATDRLASEAAYRNAVKVYGTAAGGAAGALGGLIVGWIPCGIVSSIFELFLTKREAWRWYFFLWLACAAAGGIANWSTGRVWVASESRDHSATTRHGLLIALLCMGIGAFLVSQQVSAYDHDVTFRLENVKIGYNSNNDRDEAKRVIKPATHFSTLPARVFVDATFANATGKEGFAITLSGGGLSDVSCYPTPVVGRRTTGCRFEVGQAGAYSFELKVNGKVVGIYPFSVGNGPPGSDY